MRLTPHEKDTFHIFATIAVFVLAIISSALAIWAGLAARDNFRAELSERSQSIAATLGANEVNELSGTPDDEDNQTYHHLKDTLANAKNANPDVRSIYIMGQQDGQLFFFVDSERPDSEVYSSAGEPYNDGTPENHAIFENGQPLVEGPERDNFGTFVSGLAPITTDNKVIAVLGMDVNAATYWADIIAATLMPLLIGAVLILVTIVFERIRRHNAELLALRSELVAVASHELRTPITGIRWAAESIQKIATDPQVLTMAEAIVHSALHLQNSTNDILELSHATNGRALDSKPTDIVALVAEVVETQKLGAEQKQVGIVFDKYWPPKLTLTVDADQMRRAIHNVISNAIKYTRNGTTITVSYQHDAKQHKILITDQGIGIPASEQSKVFRGFYRASNAAKSDIPGTGLGLYLVKTVLERHGGSVEFVSEENRGTTFILTLPK